MEYRNRESHGHILEPFFVKGWRESIYTAKQDSRLNIMTVNEISQNPQQDRATIMHHQLFLEELDRPIDIRLVRNNPEGTPLLDKVAKLFLLEVEVPQHPFVIVEYELPKPPIKAYFRYLKMVKSILSSETVMTDDNNPLYQLDKIFISKETETLPIKLNETQRGRLTAYISQPLGYFCNSYLNTKDLLLGYMTVWIRSIKNIGPKIDKFSKDLRSDV